MSEEKGAGGKVRKAYTYGAVLVTVLMIGVSFGVMISGQGPTGFPTVIEPGSQVGDFSYHVFVDGAIYYVRNGSTGAIDTSGTNASTVIQWAIDNVPRIGGAVSFGSGTFTLYCAGTDANEPSKPYCLRITPNHPPIELRGSGTGTILKLASYQPTESVMLMMKGPSTTPRLNRTLIEGFTFDGNGQYQPAWTDMGDVTGIYAQNITISRSTFIHQISRSVNLLRLSMNFLIEGCTFIQDMGISFRIEVPNGHVRDCLLIGNDSLVSYPIAALATNTDIYVQGSNITLSGNTFIGGYYQMMVQASGVIINNNVFRNCLANANSESLRFSPYNGAGTNDWAAQYNTVVSNYFYNFRVGIRLVYDAGPAKGSNYTLISNNIFQDGPDATATKGVTEDAGCNYNAIVNNQFIGSYSTRAVVATGQNTEVHFNTGFITEAYGNTTIIASTTVTVTHGMAGAPTYLSVGFNSSAGDWSWTGNGSQFTITVETSGTYYVMWYAYFDPVP